jgi:hypothetical protein
VEDVGEPRIIGNGRHSEGDERVLGELFALSSVTCISSCWIFRADSRDSLASFRQASHIVEMVPIVETTKVPPETTRQGSSMNRAGALEREKFAKEDNAGHHS